MDTWELYPYIYKPIKIKTKNSVDNLFHEYKCNFFVCEKKKNFFLFFKKDKGNNNPISEKLT